MPNPNQDMLDQRNNSSIEDSAMTIEFLRARLLSERSVSRSARQRADELAKRVEELEEQLKIVSQQRKMAEKATVDVLAILESQGISDTSEAFDSSSDQETHQESQVGYNFTNEEESPVFTKRRSELEEFSGSDLDSSPVTGRSLSWKGRNDSQRSREKYKDPSMRRRNAFAYICSSPKHRLGTSCRKIRRRDNRTVDEEFKAEHPKFHSSETGVSASRESVQNSLDHGPEVLRESSEIPEVPVEGSLSGSIANQRTPDDGLDSNGHGRDRDMEKALEHQAQLIGRYEEMEKAQREWEEKFRENNASTMRLHYWVIQHSFDPGSHSDITEERDEVKAQLPYPVELGDTKAEEVKSKEIDVLISKELSEPKSNGFLPPSHINLGGAKDRSSSTTSDAKFQAQEFAKPNGILPSSHVMGDKNQTSSNTVDSKFQTQEFVFPTAKEKQSQEIKENQDHQPPESAHHDRLLHGQLGNQSPDASSSDAGSSFHREDGSGRRNDLYALVPHNPPHALGGVLDALKNAKLSLQQKMNGLQLAEGTSIDKAIAPSVPATGAGDRMEVPIGCAGLFRLPTDFAVEEATARTNLLGRGSQIPLSKFYPDKGLAVTVTDQFINAPYMETRSSTFSTSDRFLRSHSVESDLRVSSTLNSSFDPYLDTGLSSFNRYNNNYPTYPSYPTFPELMPQIPPNGVFSRHHSSRHFGNPADQLSFYNDHTRHNMYM
ncbi:uncharacterized protein LOC107413193 isoform X1 [Ziziphus jujuba]|uniref:Uncharacterized protein LOC107413193 isoform X1 n=2 Tax=Ziziphus jujuba TaxID=326968 RepID=A0A6P6G024_ZIZJJ|nr:uncharacterized protein LOC107413193 isoform X1 [Ziziphus jujuba]